MVGQKSLTFGPSAKRLIGRMRPDRTKASLVVLLAVVSVTFAVLGPWLLGKGTDVIFDAVLADRPVDFSEAAFYLFPYGGVHLAGEHILAQVARVQLGVPLGLPEVPFVFGHAFLYAHQFIAQTYQPLSLALYELLVQLLISQLVPPDLFQASKN